MRKFLLPMLAILSIFLSCTRNGEAEREMETYSDVQIEQRYEEIKEIFTVLSPKVIRPAEGYLRFPYLIPAGYYTQMWDWDGFFMGTYFCSKNKPEYLQYWALNLLQGIDEKGYTSGCATIDGPRPIFGDFSMKPFLSQGVLIASRYLNDFEWVKDYYEKLKTTISYREKTQKDGPTGLFYWQNAMQSGADNNVALNYFEEDPRSFLACDASTMQLREYEAMSVIADSLGYGEDAQIYRERADVLSKAINEHLWCEEEHTYYNVDRETGEFYRRITYSNFWPLFDHIAPEADAKAMIETYLLSSEHMLSGYGLRTLSKSDPDYNNKNMIAPFSNWQGPVWPIANYIYSIALKQYGYDDAVRWVAMKITDLLVEDYKNCGTMHENYDADTGLPLAPSNSHRDAEGNIIGFISWNLCFESLLECITTGRWNLLEVD